MLTDAIINYEEYFNLFGDHDKKLILFGTSEVAELANFILKNSPLLYVALLLTMSLSKKQPTWGFLNSFSNITRSHPPNVYYLHVALSYTKLNTLRAEKFSECQNKGYIMPSYVCSRSVFWDDLSIGSNCFVLENQTLQPNVVLGDNVVLWSRNVGHGTTIGNHTYVITCCFSGHCMVGQRNFLV